MAHTSKVDWERVETLYRIGRLSIREIAKQCGDCTDTAIRKRARDFRWEQDLTAKIEAKVRSKMVRTMVREQEVANRGRSDAEIVEANATSTVQVLTGQRTEIARSFSMVATAKSSIERHLELEAHDMKLTVGLIGLLKDLAIIEKTYIGLQRQAYGIKDDSDEGKDTYEDRLQRIALEPA